jgi:valyl-tRNA synthetase
MGQRHNLTPINVMNGDGTMNEAAGPYAGLDRFECRKKMLEDLRRPGCSRRSRSTSTPSATATAATRWSSRACRRSGS